MFFSARAELAKAIALNEQLKAELEACRTLQRQVAELQEAVASLEDKHVRLRGAFYAARGQLNSTETAAPQALTKAELLRRAGFTPGRPMIHREEGSG